MLKTKEGEFSLVAIIALLFGTILAVSAQVLNSTDNPAIVLNQTLELNETINLTSPLDNGTISNTSINTSSAENTTNESTIEIPVIVGNLSINKSINLIENETINITFPKKQKNLSEIVEKNKNKLNNATEKYLKDLKDKKEEKEFIVKFRNSIDENKLADVVIDKEIAEFKLTKIKGKVENVENLIEDEEIEFIELEQDVEILGENIPFNIKKIKADSAWNSSKGSGVKVAVLDTGIGLHDDLLIVGGASFVDDNYYDSNGHGTAVAGVIAALLNDEGLVGVSPDVSLYSVKIMQSSTGELSNAIAGIEWAINNSMDIVSMSFGFNSYSQIFKEVLLEAHNNNILLIAASGNDGTDNILYPAKYSTVIAVGATTGDDNLAYFSSYGFEQELVAPGVDINSTSLGNSYSISSGTSLATPHAAGAAALIKAFNNSLTNEQIRAKLRNDALDLGTAGKDDLYGYGLVQIKLDANNFSFFNNSYYYEVFNVSNYGLPNISFIFWLFGNGSIDDVDFKHGYYLVNITFKDGKKKSRYYYANENDTLILLTSLNFNDNYLGEGSSSNDAVVWTGGSLTYNNSDPHTERDAECFDDEYLDDSFMDACYYKPGKLDQCNDFSDGGNPGDDRYIFFEVCHNSSKICTTVVPHVQSLSTSTRGQKQSAIIEYIDCDDSAFVRGWDLDPTPFYHIIDAKRAICDNNVSYHYEGRYSATQWVTYKSASCSTTCDASLDDQIITTESGTVPNPCSSPVSTCSGTANVGVENSDDSNFTGYYVYVNGVSNGTTNAGGTKQVEFNVECGIEQTINVSCKNNQSKVCESKTTSIDFSGDNDSLVFNCNKCSNNKDLSFVSNGIRLRQLSGDIYAINVTVSSQNVDSDVNVTVKGQNPNGLIERENSTITSISTGTNYAIVNFNTNNVNYFHIYIDPKNQIAEADEANNYQLRPFIRKPIKAYLEVNTSFPKADQAIEEYLSAFIDRQATSSSSYLNIIIGRNSATFKNTLNSHTRKAPNNYYYDGSSIIYSDNIKIGTIPYTSIVGRFYITDTGKDYLIAYGVDVEGDVAAVRELVSNKDYLTDNRLPDRSIVLDRYDVSALTVMDLFHNRENQPYYTQKYKSSTNFKNVVDKILNDNAYEIAIKTVQTLYTTSYSQNTTLRLKNLNSDHSDNFKDAVLNNTKPVVMSGGIFSDLFTFEDGLGGDLVKAGYDVWTIEMNGGPQIECSTCPDYTYQDQVDYYWPALIAGVIRYSGKNQINYIGHSNGCRVALSSLNSYSNGKNNAGYTFNTQTGLYDTLVDLPQKPVDKFFGIACPAILNDGSSFTLLTRTNIGNSELSGNYAMRKINQSGKTHIKKFDYISWLTLYTTDPIGDIALLKSLFEDEKISKNLMQFYNDLSINENSLISLNNINISKLYLFNADPNDLIVPLNDRDFVINNTNLINPSLKKNFTYNGKFINNHGRIKDREKVKTDLMEVLK